MNRSSLSVPLLSVILTLLTVMATAQDVSNIPSERSKFHLFLLAGQSNMAGRGKPEPADKLINPRIHMLDQSGAWIPAVDPLHYDKPRVIGVGPGRSFALEYARAHPDVTVGLIPCSAGGSPIDSWTVGGYHSQTNSHPYDEALDRTKLALKQGVLKGVLWHQGESDSKTKLSDAYQGKLVDLIQRFRTEFADEQLPFIIGQLGMFPVRPWDDHRRRVDAAHKQVAADDPRCEFATSRGLKHKGDNVHFDSASARELGRRFFAAYQRVVGDSQPELIEVKRIWDRAKHNAFTDLTRFKDQWYCVFREGQAHVSPDGALRVLRSKDGEQWESAALIQDSGSDLRDAKITVTPDGQLMLSGAGAIHPPAEYKHQSFTWFSSDGENWSDAYPVGDRDIWLWRSTWHKNVAYGFGYVTNRSTDRFLRLYRSDDGKRYTTHVGKLEAHGYPNETSMVFLDNDICFCLLRRDPSGDSGNGLVGYAIPPYTDWTFTDLGIRIGGPHALQLPDGRMVAAVRLYTPKARTALGWLDPEQGKLTEFLSLPSGGDTSYPGLVWHDGELWVSYYSSHEAKDNPFSSAIYMARVRVP